MIPDLNTPVAVFEDGRQYSFYLETHHHRGNRIVAPILFRHRDQNGEISHQITISLVIAMWTRPVTANGIPYSYIDQQYWVVSDGVRIRNNGNLMCDDKLMWTTRHDMHLTIELIDQTAFEHTIVYIHAPEQTMLLATHITIQDACWGRPKTSAITCNGNCNQLKGPAICNSDGLCECDVHEAFSKSF